MMRVVRNLGMRISANRWMLSATIGRLVARVLVDGGYGLARARLMWTSYFTSRKGDAKAPF